MYGSSALIEVSECVEEGGWSTEGEERGERRGGGGGVTLECTVTMTKNAPSLVWCFLFVFLLRNREGLTGIIIYLEDGRETEREEVICAWR